MEPPQPVAASARAPLLDLLRGVAILGILPVNAAVFSLVSDSHLSPWMWESPSPADIKAFAVIHGFFAMKFYPVFALLFGAGIALQTSRVEGRGHAPGKYIFRRLGFLFAAGVLHATLLWEGDILLWYALIGTLVYAMRKLSVRTLVMTGLVGIFVPLFLVMAPLALLTGVVDTYGNNGAIDPATMNIVNEMQATMGMGQKMGYIFEHWGSQGARAAEMNFKLYGSWFEVFALRMVLLMLYAFSMMLMTIWMVGGYMLLGVAAVRKGLFHAPQRHPQLFRALLYGGLLVGVPLQGLATWMAIQPYALAMATGMIAVMIGAFFMVGLFVAIAAKVVESPLAVRLTWPLRACGRMAFTNYLTQSLVMVILFQGWAVGLAGMQYRELWLYVILPLWGAQLVWSAAWLAVFRQGPLEALWRRFTWGKTPAAIGQ